MSDEVEFVRGFNFKERDANTPDWVIAKAGINIASFREWMKDWIAKNPDKEWLNIEIKESKAGKTYIAVNKFEKTEVDNFEQKEDVPF
jgi:hypothetical protein